MKHHVSKYVISAFTAVLFLAVSCSAPPRTQYSILATVTYGASLNTKIAPSVAWTPTALPLLTQIPSPTLSPTQISTIVKNLYNHNGGCELPCLWGIVPGKTSVQDVYSRFSEIGHFEDYTRAVDVFQVIYFTTVPPNNLVSLFSDGGWGFSMRVKDNTVIGFVTASVNIKQFSTPSLAKFLTDFGKPEEIRVRIIESMLRDENPDYEIALYYPSKGIFVRWRGRTESVVAKTEKNITVMVCPQHMPEETDTSEGLSPPFFYLFSPDKDVPFEEIIKIHLAEDPSGSYQPLGEANVEKFYTMYLAPTKQDCFPISYSFSR